MKKIEAIVRPEKVDPVRAALEGVGYPGLMITEISGHGRQKGVTQQWRGESYRLDILPKVKLEIVVPDKDFEKILKVITESAATGNVGDGKIFVTEVVQAVRIRTGERGEPAL